MDPSLHNIVILLGVLCPLLTVAYPSGKVEGSCDSMEPGHGTTGQTSSAPYTLTLSQNSYSDGEKLTVTLSSNPGAVQFKGFLIQARAGSSNTPLGSFQISGSDAQILTCSTLPSAVSHTSASSKASVQVTWVAPSTNIPDIQFRATVVQVKTIYWNTVLGPKLTYIKVPASTNATAASGATMTSGTTAASNTTVASGATATSKATAASGATATSKATVASGATSALGGHGKHSGFRLFAPSLYELTFYAMIVVAALLRV
ncbi:putative defense protein 3 isoform X1 [Ascaphus truei]|uniref:putative defense protein 3 isoform X1 n=1 Tax=Ascaphus truei TaxID=8439 RepID=UPI003F59CEED